MTETGGQSAALVEQVLAEFGRFGAGEQGRAFHAWKRQALSITNLNVLTLLASEGPLSMGRLAAALDVSVASATGIVARMERRGLVCRERSSADLRVVVVTATDSGRSTLDQLGARRRELLRRMLEELTADELGALLIGVRAIYAARERVHAAGGEAGPGPTREASQGSR